MVDEQPRKPWASGPQEILVHGLSLLSIESDRNRRLAMINIDNAVELMMKTYLGLPRRATGLTIKRAELAEAFQSFPNLLDAMDKYAVDKLTGVHLDEVEWYHRLRNELYHNGNGLTVERTKVVVYADLAKMLFENLFGYSISSLQPDTAPTHSADILLGRFLRGWHHLEFLVARLHAKYIQEPELGRKPQVISVSLLVRDLERVVEIRRITIGGEPLIPAIERLRRLRNEIVHGVQDYTDVLNDSVLSLLEQISGDLEGLIE